jgi:hypothetical protein
MVDKEAVIVATYKIREECDNIDKALQKKDK